MKRLPPGVYLMRATDGLLWKIGRSRTPQTRLRRVRAEMRAATVVHVLQTDDAVALERALHRRFAAVRDQGEWFRLTAADVSWFCAQQRVLMHEPPPPAPALVPAPAPAPVVRAAPRADDPRLVSAYASLGWGL